MGERWRCEYDGKNLKPCKGLESIADGYGLSKRKGIYLPVLINFETGKKRNGEAHIKCKQYPQGMILNFCPICGEQIFDFEAESRKIEEKQQEPTQ